jgi:para-nitrobenzyl esterase
VYAYEDDDSDSPPPPTTTPETQPLGAYHRAINRLGHDAPASLDPNQAALQSQVLAEWTGFARAGQPTVSDSRLWTPCTTRGQPVMSLESRPGTAR